MQAGDVARTRADLSKKAITPKEVMAFLLFSPPLEAS
jgi:hypothetical protein